MQTKTIHLHQSRLNRQSSSLLLMIPSVVFALVLAIYLFQLKAALDQNQILSNLAAVSNTN